MSSVVNKPVIMSVYDRCTRLSGYKFVFVTSIPNLLDVGIIDS